jgi:hypothetical protein
MNTSAGRYVLGVAALLVIFGSLAVSAVALRRRILPDWTGAPARLAETVIGLALLIGLLELLGAVGWFAFGPVLAACVIAALLIARRFGPVRATGPRVSPEAAPGSGRGWGPRLVWMLAVAAGAAVLAEWGALTVQSYDVGIRGFDSLWYHLPWAASFAQTGRITTLRFTDVEYLTAFYPATAEVLHGLGIVLLGRDTLSPALNLLWLGLVLLAAYCVGRPRGLGGATLIGAAVAMGVSMMDYSQAGAAANDVVAVFFLLAAVALLMEGAESTGARVLAAVAAGLALGVKLTVAAPVLALTIGVVAIAPRGRRLMAGTLWLGPLVLAGGYWYARNLIAVGNPLPWTSVGGLLPTPAAPLQQHTGYAVAHYLTSTHLWHGFFEPALASGLGRWWYVIVGAAILGPLLCLLPRSGRVVQMLGAVSLCSLAGYLITPETAAGPAGDPLGFAFNLRYLAPALALSLTVLPLAPVLGGPRLPSLARRGRVSIPEPASPARRVASAIALAALLAGTVAQTQLWPAQHRVEAIVIGSVAVLVALAAVAPRPVPAEQVTWRPYGRSERATRSRVPLVLAAVVLLIAGAGAGYRLQAHYLRGRYVYHPGVSYLARVWALFRTVHHARVGVVGTYGGFFAYPLFGVDDSNRVQYIARRGAHGSFTPIGTCPEWRTAVNAARVQYLITTPARDPWNPDVLTPSPETGWTESDAAAVPVFSERAEGQPIVVFRITGPLDAGSCSRPAAKLRFHDHRVRPSH